MKQRAIAAIVGASVAGDSNDVAGNAAAFAGDFDEVTGDSNELQCKGSSR
jgi:hypothetical protein